MSRHGEVTTIEFTTIAEFILAIGMLIRGFIWIFFLKDKASLKYRPLLIGIYYFPIMHLIYFHLSVLFPHTPY